MSRRPVLVTVSLLLGLCTSACSTGPLQTWKAKRAANTVAATVVGQPEHRPAGQLAKVPFLFRPDAERKIPPQTRLVIMDFEGPCSGNVKDALMRRLVENSRYQVLTRDNLRQILRENQMQWGGNFNTLTANRIGDLLGASMFIVGRVILCQTAYDTRTEDLASVEIVAALQVLDLRTGRVVASSASTGLYEVEDDGFFYSYNGREPQSAFMSWLQRSPLAERLSAFVGLGAQSSVEVQARTGGEGTLGGLFEGSGGFGGGFGAGLGDGCADGEPICPVRCWNDPIIDDRIYEHGYIRAAEELAKDFADRFFTRPSWFDLEMWIHGDERYGEVVHQVKLGHCGEAIALLDEFAADDVATMPRAEVAELMHNYGVALLCADRPEDGIRKLQSAYRLVYHPSSLRMVDIGTKMLEWSLEPTPDIEPETDIVLARDDFFDEDPSVDFLFPTETSRSSPTEATVDRSPPLEPPLESIDAVDVDSGEVVVEGSDALR